jgi:hypothetical protein
MSLIALILHGEKRDPSLLNPHGQAAGGVKDMAITVSRISAYLHTFPNSLIYGGRSICVVTLISYNERGTLIAVGEFDPTC